MAVPKRKTSKSRSGSRKAQWKSSLKLPPLVECPQCHDLKLSYRACPSCGTYDGREVIETSKK